MSPLTGGRPKCLLELHGKTLLRHQLDMLAGFGIRDIAVATGFAAAAVEAEARDRASFQRCPDFASTNNLYTLHHCRHLLDAEVVLLFSDVLLPRHSLGLLLGSDHDFGLLVDTSARRADTMRVRLDGGAVCDIGSHIPAAAADGNFIGAAKFSARGAALLSAEVAAMVGAGGFRADYYTAALPRLHAAGWRIEPVRLDGSPWLELDSPRDYRAAARADFYLP